METNITDPLKFMSQNSNKILTSNDINMKFNSDEKKKKISLNYYNEVNDIFVDLWCIKSN